MRQGHNIPVLSQEATKQQNEAFISELQTKISPRGETTNHEQSHSANKMNATGKSPNHIGNEEKRPISPPRRLNQTETKPISSPMMMIHSNNSSSSSSTTMMNKIGSPPKKFFGFGNQNGDNQSQHNNNTNINNNNNNNNNANFNNNANNNINNNYCKPNNNNKNYKKQNPNINNNYNNNNNTNNINNNNNYNYNNNIQSNNNNLNMSSSSNNNNSNKKGGMMMRKKKQKKSDIDIESPKSEGSKRQQNNSPNPNLNITQLAPVKDKKMRFLEPEDDIDPMPKSHEFTQIILYHMEVAATILDVCSLPTTNETHLLSNAILSFYSSNRVEQKLITFALSRDCALSTESATLFRENSSASMLLSTYMKMKCLAYIEDLLLPFFDKHIRNIKDAIEVDKNRCSEIHISQNVVLLTSMVHQLLDVVFSSAVHFPSSMKNIFKHLYRMVSKKYPEMGLEIVGGFYFLRFFCPIFVSPETFFLPYRVSAGARRTMILISKVIQNMSNGVLFGLKEEFMSPFNAVMTQRMGEMKDFLRTICEPPYDGSFFSPKFQLQDREEYHQPLPKNLPIKFIASKLIANFERFSERFKNDEILDKLISTLNVPPVTPAPKPPVVEDKVMVISDVDGEEVNVINGKVLISRDELRSLRDGLSQCEDELRETKNRLEEESTLRKTMQEIIHQLADNMHSLIDEGIREKLVSMSMNFENMEKHKSYDVSDIIRKSMKLNDQIYLTFNNELSNIDNNNNNINNNNNPHLLNPSITINSSPSSSPSTLKLNQLNRHYTVSNELQFPMRTLSHVQQFGTPTNNNNNSNNNNINNNNINNMNINNVNINNMSPSPNRVNNNNNSSSNNQTQYYRGNSPMNDNTPQKNFNSLKAVSGPTLHSTSNMGSPPINNNNNVNGQIGDKPKFNTALSSGNITRGVRGNMIGKRSKVKVADNERDDDEDDEDGDHLQPKRRSTPLPSEFDEFQKSLPPL